MRTAAHCLIRSKLIIVSGLPDCFKKLKPQLTFNLVQFGDTWGRFQQDLCVCDKDDNHLANIEQIWQMEYSLRLLNYSIAVVGKIEWHIFAKWQFTGEFLLGAQSLAKLTLSFVVS